MKKSRAIAIEKIIELLRAIGFAPAFASRQTAVCLYALADETRRPGLLAGKLSLSDGARIHDIMEFARQDLGIRVAENTRESYRKTSIAPLLGAGLISRVRSSVNDPNTHYQINRTFASTMVRYIAAKTAKERQAIADDWMAAASGLTPPARTKRGRVEAGSLAVRVGAAQVTLSPGGHNLLIKQIAEVFAPVFVDESPEVLLLSDAENKLRHVNPLAARLGLRIDEHEKMPDVLLYSPSRNILYVIEAVTSAGPMSPARVRDIESVLLPEKLSFGLEYFTVFPDRSVFKRFLEDIAWGTQVWLANEPFGVVVFRRVR
jgi:hypothetical protein